MQNTISVSQLSVRQGARLSSSTNKGLVGQDGEMMDPFLQIIMNLISQNPDEQFTQEILANSDFSEISELFQTPQGVSALDLMSLLQMTQPLQSVDMEQKTQTDGFKTALAELLPALGEVSEEPVNRQIKGSVIKSEMTMQAPIPDTGQALSSEMQKAFQQTERTIAVNGEATTYDGTPRIGDDPTNIGTAIKTSEDSQSSDTYQNGLGATIHKTKQTASSGASRDKTEELDIDALQSRVSQNKVETPFELRFKAVTEDTDVSLKEQVSDGIKQNISLGKSEFILKLKPESLGEITVKLIEEAGKTTVTISTASSQTAKLINSELNSLKIAVAPMNVEVNEAVTQTQQASHSNMHGFDLASQQFAQQQFSDERFNGQQGFNRSAGSRAEGNVLAGFAEESNEFHTGVQLSKKLDAYV